MTKSSRSKWKKFHRRERAEAARPLVTKRIERLKGKLDLCAKGVVSRVPMEDPETRFHFTHPELRKPGEKLVLAPLKTNPYGKSDAAAPHPQAVNVEPVPLHAPIAGKAISVVDQKKNEAAQAKSFQSSVREMLDNPDYATSDPIEIVIGCNDAEDETTGVVTKKGTMKKVTKGPKADKIKSMRSSAAAEVSGKQKLKSLGQKSRTKKP